MNTELATTGAGLPVGGPGQRVAFLCHPYHRGGVTRWMADAAAEFRRRGWAVWFVAPEPERPFGSGGGRPTMASLVRELPQHERPTLVAPPVGTAFELGTNDYRALVYARALQRGVPLSVPVIVSDDDAVWEGAAAVSAQYPMIGVLHADELKYYDLARRYRERLARCIAVSDRIAARAAEESGLSVARIPCAAPMRTQLPDSQTRQAVPRITWVGRMEQHQKRVMDLPAIARHVRESGSPVTFTLVGDGPEADALGRAIDAAGLGEVVTLAGWRSSDEIWRLLSSSDVLVLPSNYEGMPLVVMEALAAGCAVVASRVSGIEDVEQLELAEGVCFVHEIGDTREAARLIGLALQVAPAVRRERARQLAVAEFSIEACIDRYVRALDDVSVARAAGQSRRIALENLAVRAVSLPLAAVRAARRRWSATVGRA